MEQVAKTAFTAAFAFVGIVLMMLLASHSIYRQDVRNCMNDSEQTEASCEARFK